MRKFIILAMVLFPAMASASPADDLDAMAKTLPHDVRAFIERKSECNHWGGEDPYDAARGKQIERAVTRLKCEALDGDEAVLKRRHAKNAAVGKALAQADEIYQ
jgi:hypothetical protein